MVEICPASWHGDVHCYITSALKGAVQSAQHAEAPPGGNYMHVSNLMEALAALANSDEGLLRCQERCHKACSGRRDPSFYDVSA